MILTPGNLYKVKHPLTGYLRLHDPVGVLVPKDAIMVYMKMKEKRRKSGSPLYFLWDSKIIRISNYSFKHGWMSSDKAEVYEYHFEEIQTD
jgi:hypothetical protein